MSMDRRPFAAALGIDIGTSGVRIAAVDADGSVLHIADQTFTDTVSARSPATWWRAVQTCMTSLAAAVSLSIVEAIAVDGTSGTMIAVDREGVPVGEPLMYNDACPDMAIVERIATHAPPDSAARGATSALARAIYLSRQAGAHRILHQADWILMKLGFDRATSDENNALKTGYDLAGERWPDWLEACGMDIALLPDVARAGMPLGRISRSAGDIGLPASCYYHAGTTDGCASFLATGASGMGDGVTALGSTLVLKLASDTPVNAASYGIYSHRVLDFWLAGGASNSGGAVIRHFFDDIALKTMTPLLRPEEPTGLDYYPLLRPGERFPVNDPAWPVRLEPRPKEQLLFFQAILEGIAAIEKAGYDRLTEFGGPSLASVRTVGGGAANRAWSQMRHAALGVPLLSSRSSEAAVGTASLALAGKARWT